MNERLKKLRKTLDLTQQKFADRLGVKRNTVGQWECGINAITDQVVFSICRDFDVNEEWLRTGEGEMFAAPTAASDKIMDFAAEIARNDDKEFRKRLVVMLADLEPKDWELLERIAEKLTT